jgi:hypothetical protein
MFRDGFEITPDNQIKQRFYYLKPLSKCYEIERVGTPPSKFFPITELTSEQTFIIKGIFIEIPEFDVDITMVDGEEKTVIAWKFLREKGWAKVDFQVNNKKYCIFGRNFWGIFYPLALPPDVCDLITVKLNYPKSEGYNSDYKYFANANVEKIIQTIKTRAGSG